jgi:hypothetical protein
MLLPPRAALRAPSGAVIIADPEVLEAEPPLNLTAAAFSV